MTDPDFPESLRSLIQEAFPSVEAVELLLKLALDPGRAYALKDLVEALRPTAITEAAAQRYLAQFQSRGLVAAAPEGYRYSPDSPELDSAVRALIKVYNERPVTLVRIIYAPKDEKIRSFADAFRIKKE